MYLFTGTQKEKGLVVHNTYVLFFNEGFCKLSTVQLFWTFGVERSIKTKCLKINKISLQVCDDFCKVIYVEQNCPTFTIKSAEKNQHQTAQLFILWSLPGLACKITRLLIIGFNVGYNGSNVGGLIEIYETITLFY